MIHPTTTAWRWGGHPAKWLAGFIPDVPTPFDASGAIDLAAFVHLCERQITAGATALVIGETAGETSTLTSAERTLLIRTATETSDKRVHVIAGAGSNATGRAVELTRQAAAAGADAIMSVVPHYNRPMQEGIYAHFSAVGEATALPIVLHDCPSRTARPLADDTLARLVRSSQFVGLARRHRRRCTGLAIARMPTTGLPPLVRRRCDGAGLSCRRRRRLHLGDRQRRSGALCRDRLAWPAPALACRPAGAQAACAIDRGLRAGGARCVETRAEPAGVDATRHAAAAGRIGQSCQGRGH